MVTVILHGQGDGHGHGHGQCHTFICILLAHVHSQVAIAIATSMFMVMAIAMVIVLIIWIVIDMIITELSVLGGMQYTRSDVVTAILSFSGPTHTVFGLGVVPAFHCILTKKCTVIVKVNVVTPS